jgi:signal transduction histidine kinase
MDAAGRSLTSRIRRIDAIEIDRVVAVVGVVGGLLDASSQPHRNLGVVAVISLGVLMGSVAWRRVDPVLSTLAGTSGLIAFVLASGYNGDGSFEAAAIALNFYLLGQRGRANRRPLIWAGAFVYWLIATVVITYAPPPPPAGSVGAVVGAMALFGFLPFGFGWALATQAELAGELEQRTSQLDEEQAIRAIHAAAEERLRIARDLHDVIAHCLSVMVVQTSAARMIADSDIDAAREALAVVESTGREALVEFRRIVGVLRRESDQLDGAPALGVRQLSGLADRATAVGLPVTLSVTGSAAALSPSLSLVTYRLVQEALTNAIRYAGAARAEVRVHIGTDELELSVRDTGRRPPARRGRGDQSGHGLVGMRERVGLYGGEFQAGPHAEGGFLVHARIPLRGSLSARQARRSSPAPERLSPVMAGDATARLPWLDWLLASLLVAVFEVELITSGHRRGSFVLNVIVVAGVGLTAAGRRRSPLLFVLFVGALTAVMRAFLIPPQDLALITAYLLLIVPYTVAAWADRRRACIGLVILLGGAAVGVMVAGHTDFWDVGGGALIMITAWCAGRGIQSRRTVNSELRQTAGRLVAEREDRAMLAVAGERSRIARELHAVVARSVASMVVQTEATRTQLERDADQAQAAMEAIERGGRDALAEMRRILGVLRHPDERGERAPRPGIDQIYALIQRARVLGQLIELTVDGDPGTLTAGHDLAIYRILEEVLDGAEGKMVFPIKVSLACAPDELALCVTTTSPHTPDWPTDTMAQRVALCGGELSIEVAPDHSSTLTARLPLATQEALV